MTNVTYGTTLQQSPYITAPTAAYVVLGKGLARISSIARFHAPAFILYLILRQTCNVCMSISLQGSHRCIERNTECDCPICGDYLFTSPETVVFMPCGHSIHQKCYNQHIKTFASHFFFHTMVHSLTTIDLIDVQLVLEPLSTWTTISVFSTLKSADSQCPHLMTNGRR